MKIILSFFILGFCLVTSTQSCKKTNTSTQDAKTINVVLKNNEDYSYDLGGFGDEEGVTITQQAMHYQISSLNRDTYITYQYKPALNYTGTDEVKLKSAKRSNGIGPSNKITITTIKFTITN